MSPAKKKLADVEAANPRVVAAANKLNRYMKEESLPHWFRGLSTFQVAAINGLFNAIRDDFEQHSTHRVIDSLKRLGLDPVINAKQAFFLMKLSRCNDLAFLWFLMELRYSDPTLPKSMKARKHFSVNEQLILSAIAHLDMIPTLRELDRLLPKGYPPRKHTVPKFTIGKQEYVKVRDGPATDPYTQPLRLPRLLNPNLYAQEPDLIVNLGEFEQYKNPDFTLPGESNKWYTDYEVSNTKRVVFRCLRDVLEDIFKDMRSLSKKYDEQVMLCAKHREPDIGETFLTKLRRRDDCMQLVDVDKKKRDARLQRIRNLIEQDLKEHNKKERIRALRWSKIEEGKVHLIVLKGDGEYECQVKESSECALPLDECMQTEPFSKVDDEIESSDSMSKKEGKRHGGECSEHTLYGIAALSKSGYKMCSLTGSDMREPQEGVVVAGSDDLITEENSSQIFFQAPTPNEPYTFNYKKIFKLDKTPSEEMKQLIHEYCLKALSESDINDGRTSTKSRRASSKCMAQETATCTGEQLPERPKRKFKEALEGYVSQYVAQRIEEKTRQMEEEENKSESALMAEKFGVSYFDPDNAELMSAMLQDALSTMSKNPKFVLASMPEAYKLPILREWIRRRYGKVYTKEERQSALQLSLELFQAFSGMFKKSAINLRDYGTTGSSDYGCFDYLQKKRYYVTKLYNDSLNNQLMEDSRLLWLAMRAFLCKDPRNTFYAYVPANTRQITRFRPWRASSDAAPSKKRSLLASLLNIDGDDAPTDMDGGGPESQALGSASAAHIYPSTHAVQVGNRSIKSQPPTGKRRHG